MGQVTSVETRIAHVTVYADGARIRRSATLAAVPAGVRLVGLPLAVIDDTIRIEVEGAAIATNLRVGLDALTPDAAATEDSAELRAARRRAAIAEAEHARLEQALAGAHAAQLVVEDPSDEPPAAWHAVVAARRAAIEVKADRVRTLLEQLPAVRRELDEARRALTAITDRERRAGTARTPKLHELRKHVDVELTARGGEGAVTIHLEYLVSAARWAPSYVARLDGADARIEIRANVAQDTGEDWTAVRIALSTAQPTRFAVLPELAPQRIGRRQEPVARSGFRPPPSGAGELYADFLRDAVAPAPPPPPRMESKPLPPPAPMPLAASEAFLEDEDAAPIMARKKSAMRGRAAAAPMRSEMSLDARAAAFSGGLPGGAAAELAPPPPPAAEPRLDYANLRMAPPSSWQRGQLIPAPESAHGAELARLVADARGRIAALPLPPRFVDRWAQGYDYAYGSDAAVDVRADGAWHSIPVTASAGTAKVTHVAVPREQADVFRVARLANPFAGPLLPGPIDVYDRGSFLVTSDVELTPPGASVEIGLGVDAAVKIARNSDFREEATGMLRGGLRLVHAITVDVENVSGRAIELEVRERIPVAPEHADDVEVAIGRVEPPWERWTPDPDAPSHARLRGAYRWRVTLAAGTKQALRAGYEVKIAGKHELVGGNRREP